MQTQLDCPDILNNVDVSDLHVCSCDGILCFTIKDQYPLLWNPSIRRFDTFPHFKHPGRAKRILQSTFSFGYVHSTRNYKIVAVSFFEVNKYGVSVYTLGTDSWRRIQDFPYSGPGPMPGVFVSDTINWLTYDASSSLHVIVSLDLKNELYQNLLKPDTNKDYWTMGKLRDCLCIFTGSKIDMLVDVWIMKEYGNTKPWTKLYIVPYMGDQVSSTFYSKALYISEDGKVLMGFQEFLFVYDSKNGTFNMLGFQNISGWLDPEVYVESLISPCS